MQAGDKDYIAPLTTDGTPAAAPAPTGNRETANSARLARLVAAFQRGEEVVFSVRTRVDEVHKWGGIGSHEVRINKSAVVLRAKGGQDIFVVAPEDIVEVDREPKSWRLRMTVAAKNASGGKGRKQKVDLFHPGTWEMSRQLFCTECDTSMDSLYALLQKARGQDYEATLAESEAAARNEARTRQMQKERYEAEVARIAAECPGIELMGIYKNELVSREMSQGGMEEWLARIRNNTSVTRIVKFGWIDQYGQQQVAQVQLRGGELATPRLDLTQKRFVAPVRDLKLVSCQ